MKTKEFIEKVEELGLITGYDTYLDYEIRILVEGVGVVAEIKVHSSYHAKVYFPSNNELPRDIAKELFDLIYAYASTPINKREDAKYRYRIGNDVLVRYTGKEHFYKLYASDEVEESRMFKLSFTDTESEELPLWVKQLYYRGHLVKEEVE